MFLFLCTCYCLCVLNVYMCLFVCLFVFNSSDQIKQGLRILAKRKYTCMFYLKFEVRLVEYDAILVYKG